MAITTTPAQDQILAAYIETATKTQDWVPLRSLRAKFIGSRDEQDAALIGLIRTGMVHLAPDSNRKTLTQADHDAAIRIGGEDNHLIAIEEELLEG